MMTKMKHWAVLPLLFGAISLFAACSGEDPDNGGNNGGNNGGDELPAVWSQFNSDLNIYLDGTFVVVETTDIPDHPSPYFAENDPNYEAYNSQDFRKNPNSIAEQNVTFRIPADPSEASTKTSTRLGPIGVAVNGVVFYNQYAGPDQPLTDEIISFDQYSGHPDGQNAYHYHIEPNYLTEQYGADALIGFLLDGFPVYGPQENGAAITNNDLDEYHGHFGVTADYPNGIYHYHFTNTDPYINGGQYFGTVGTVTF